MPDPLASLSTVVDLLRYRAQQQPDKTVYTFLQDGEIEAGHLTYQHLDRQAQAIAAHLQTLTSKGDRVLVIYPYGAGLAFIAGFFGCLYAGCIAVSCIPLRTNSFWADLKQRVNSAQATVVLTTQSLLETLKAQLSDEPELATELSHLHWLASDTLVSLPDLTWQELSLGGDEVAYLQYTSGSTGTPKGVMVTHENVLHNSAVLYHCLKPAGIECGLSWLPLFHDMGLIGGVIQPLYFDRPMILMSPIAFVQKPVRWLQAITRYQANCSTGPNFAYDLLCRTVGAAERQTLDLSSWTVALSGAEPVRVETLELFTKTFADSGFRPEAFYPCYGMAEATLFISGGTTPALPVTLYLDRVALEQQQVVPVEPTHPQARPIVGCGRAWLGDQIRIVDPNQLIECPAHQVGEIWVSGRGIGKGYWNQAQETQQTFYAFLADTGEGPFLRTGDLGFIHAGELFITGRLKDLMIFWGRNHYPHHIEQTVEQSHPALRSHGGAAFSIEVAGEEKLVIVQEVERVALRNLAADEVFTCIRTAITQEHLIDVYAIALLKPGSLPRTSSGKVQRRVCRNRFLEGALNPIREWKAQPGGSDLASLLLNPTSSSEPDF